MAFLRTSSSTSTSSISAHRRTSAAGGTPTPPLPSSPSFGAGAQLQHQQSLPPPPPPPSGAGQPGVSWSHPVVNRTTSTPGPSRRPSASPASSQVGGEGHPQGQQTEWGFFGNGNGTATACGSRGSATRTHSGTASGGRSPAPNGVPTTRQGSSSRESSSGAAGGSRPPSARTRSVSSGVSEQPQWAPVPSGNAYAFGPNSPTMQMPVPQVPGRGAEPELDEAMRLSRVEAEMLNAQRESARLEEERLLRLTSTYSAEQEQLRQLRLQQDELEEDQAFRAALAQSRVEKGKGRGGPESEDERREREEMEFAMALSLSEEQNRAGRRGGETSAEIFERLSRTTQEEDRRYQGNRQGSFETSSRRPHPAFERVSSDPVLTPIVSSPTLSSPVDRDPVVTHEPVQLRLPRIASFFVVNPDEEAVDDLPPAYEYPSTAYNPRTVVLGPGRPLPQTPSPPSRPSLPPIQPSRQPSPPATPSESAPASHSGPTSPASSTPTSRSFSYTSQTSMSSAAAVYYSAPIAAAAMVGASAPTATRLPLAPLPPSSSSPAANTPLGEDDDVDPFDERIAAVAWPSEAGEDDDDRDEDDSGEGDAAANGSSVSLAPPPKDLWEVLHPHSNPVAESTPSVSPIPTRTPSPAVSAAASPSTSTLSLPTLPSASTSSLTPPTLHHAPHSSGSLRSSPLFGGLVDSSSSNAVADDVVLANVRFGFVPAVALVDPQGAGTSASGRKPPRAALEHEGAFPDVAQLSLVGGPEGDSHEFSSFAVEAGGWQGLLTYLMWHGNSHLEAAPRDLQAEKSGRGLDVAVGIEFYRMAAAPYSPRVRIRLDLLPPRHKYNALSAATSYSSLSPDHPNITIHLPHPYLLPIQLSALAMTLSNAHSLSRKRAWGISHALSGGGTGHTQHGEEEEARAVRDLAAAVDLFKTLNGETVRDDPTEVEKAEKSLLSKFAGRLKRKKRAPGLVKGGADGTGGGKPIEGEGRPLPEGAWLVTPFRLDDS